MESCRDYADDTAGESTARVFGRPHGALTSGPTTAPEVASEGASARGVSVLEVATDAADGLAASRHGRVPRAGSTASSTRTRRRQWSTTELSTVALLHSLHGNKWSLIARHFRTRHDGDVKNIFNSAVRSTTAGSDILRTYAQLVGPNYEDADARAAAYEAARAQHPNVPVLSSAAGLLPGVAGQSAEVDAEAEAAAAAAGDGGYADGDEACADEEEGAAGGVAGAGGGAAAAGMTGGSSRHGVSGISRDVSMAELVATMEPQQQQQQQQQQQRQLEDAAFAGSSAADPTNAAALLGAMSGSNRKRAARRSPTDTAGTSSSGYVSGSLPDGAAAEAAGLGTGGADGAEFTEADGSLLQQTYDSFRDPFVMLRACAPPRDGPGARSEGVSSAPTLLPLQQPSALLALASGPGVQGAGGVAWRPDSALAHFSWGEMGAAATSTANARAPHTVFGGGTSPQFPQPPPSSPLQLTLQPGAAGAAATATDAAAAGGTWRPSSTRVLPPISLDPGGHTPSEAAAELLPARSGPTSMDRVIARGGEQSSLLVAAETEDMMLKLQQQVFQQQQQQQQQQHWYMQQQRQQQQQQQQQQQVLPPQHAGAFELGTSRDGPTPVLQWGWAASLTPDGAGSSGVGPARMLDVMTLAGPRRSALGTSEDGTASGGLARYNVAAGNVARLVDTSQQDPIEALLREVEATESPFQSINKLALPMAGPSSAPALVPQSLSAAAAAAAVAARGSSAEAKRVSAGAGATWQGGAALSSATQVQGSWLRPPTALCGAAGNAGLVPELAGVARFMSSPSVLGDQPPAAACAHGGGPRQAAGASSSSFSGVATVSLGAAAGAGFTGDIRTMQLQSSAPVTGVTATTAFTSGSAPHLDRMTDSGPLTHTTWPPPVLHQQPPALPPEMLLQDLPPRVLGGVTGGHGWDASAILAQRMLRAPQLQQQSHLQPPPLQQPQEGVRAVPVSANVVQLTNLLQQQHQLLQPSAQSAQSAARQQLSLQPLEARRQQQLQDLQQRQALLQQQLQQQQRLQQQQLQQQLQLQQLHQHQQQQQHSASLPLALLSQRTEPRSGFTSGLGLGGSGSMIIPNTAGNAQGGAGLTDTFSGPAFGSQRPASLSYASLPTLGSSTPTGGTIATLAASPHAYTLTGHNVDGTPTAVSFSAGSWKAGTMSAQQQGPPGTGALPISQLPAVHSASAGTAADRPPLLRLVGAPNLAGAPPSDTFPWAVARQPPVMLRLPGHAPEDTNTGPVSAAMAALPQTQQQVHEQLQFHMEQQLRQQVQQLQQAQHRYSGGGGGGG